MVIDFRSILLYINNFLDKTVLFNRFLRAKLRWNMRSTSYRKGTLFVLLGFISFSALWMQWSAFKGVVNFAFLCENLLF